MLRTLLPIAAVFAIVKLGLQLPISHLAMQAVIGVALLALWMGFTKWKGEW